jgi:hypothetical protein
MNSKRRADLQRKLSMGAVPRPPADLADRIKADIPQYLQSTDVDRERFTGSVAFSMRVAASILMLITTAFVMLRVLQPREARQTASLAVAPRPQLVPAVSRYRTTPAANTARTAEPPAEEVRLEIEQDAPMPVPSSVAAPTAAPAAPPPAPMVMSAEAAPAAEMQTAAAGRFEAKDEAENGLVAGGRSDASEKRAAAEGFVAKTAAGRAADSIAVPEAPVPPPSAAPRPARESITVQANAPTLISEAYASELSLAQKPEVFGISVDPNVFTEMKTTLQAGNRPRAESINVDALVNYFAGPPARAPRRGVALEVEASPAPVRAEGDQAILRFTIDTPRIELRPRSSTPPAVIDARVEIEIDPKAVATFHRIGNDAPVAPESTLLQNLSVTGLYQLELRPGLKDTQHIATVRLRYRSIADGKPHTITREIHGRDLARDWSRASRRHRLASLGAVWSESLKTAATRSDVARRAEELATQEPADSRARELANAASATAGGGGGGKR